MNSRPLSLVSVAIVSAVMLTACGPGGGVDGPAEPSILTDDLDLDSYRAEGSIDGLTWSADLCALNLIPTWAVYRDGKDDPFYRMQFEAYDKDIEGGVVTGMWRLGDDVNHPVQVTSGTFSVATDAGAQKNGTISVSLEVTEYLPAGGSVDRVVSGALNLTPVVESPGCTVTDTPEYLKEALETYAGPTGGGV